MYERWTQFLFIDCPALQTVDQQYANIGSTSRDCRVKRAHVYVINRTKNNCIGSFKKIHIAKIKDEA